MYDFDEIIEKADTNSFKNDLKKQFNPNASDDCISMSIADMDFACAEPILTAMHERINKRILGYTQLDEAYYDSVANWYKTRYNYALKKENISISYGVVYAVDALVELMTSPGDSVIIFTPSYAPFKQAVDKSRSRELVCLPLVNENENYSIDFDTLREAAEQKNATLLILCSPHNPTGRIWSDKELLQIADICFSNGVRIISDEIHSDLTRIGESFTTLGKLLGNDSRLTVCTAPSKTFNLAGNWTANIFFFDEKLKQAYDERYGLLPNPVCMEAVKAAYTKCAPWLDELRVYLDESFDIIDKFIKKELPKAVFKIPQATYLAWIDFSGYIRDDKVSEDVLARGGVLGEGGQHFVGNASGHIRLNCAAPHSVLREALERIKRALIN